MDFSLEGRLVELLARVRGVIDHDVIPLEPLLADGGFARVEPALGEVREKVKAAGLWAPQLPVELGGMGLPLLEHGLISEQLGRSPLGHYAFGCQAPDAGNIEILHQYGSDAQKRRWLAPLVAGEVRSCFSMTEPDTAGSNPTTLACRATLDDGHWILEGRKWFTTGADGAAVAIVMAVTDADADPYTRASMILVPTDTPGFRLVRNIPVMGHGGSGWASHGEIAYERCRVPEENLLGGRGAGFLIAQDRLGPGRIHHCMRWLGLAERAFDLMVTRALTRDLGGKPLSSRQIVQGFIAESRASLNAARMMVLHAAWKIDAEGLYAAREEISLIKFHVARVLQDVVDKAIQTHGALGITDDTILGYLWAHERGARIYDGPDEVHMVSACKRVLERYGRETP